MATAPPAEAVGLWPGTVNPLEPAPMAIEVALVAFPPPALYCACATLPTPAPATSTAAATAFTTADLFGLPRAESCSDAATQAPRASFQIERYVRFMSCYLQMCTPHTGLFC
ncbi:hypothetical protein CSX04_05651 [Burkholderia cepacia]|nr:hypothetical protein CSX04_05651 [Burkholderia cepacia]